MQRRTFLQFASASALAAFSSRSIAAAIAETDRPWRTFELTYQVDLSGQTGAGRLWLPVPQDAGDYQRVLSTRWDAGTAQAGLHTEPHYRAPMFSAAWEADSTPPRSLRLVTRVATRDRRTPAASSFDAHDVQTYLQPTQHMPTDGIVAETAADIVKPYTEVDGKARAIYDWIVDNTFRDPAVRGCGMGNIKAMLETGNLGGKCADINSLFVGLARAAGIPAREMYGVRVAESTQLACLGKTGDVSKAQHCRAEYFSPVHGWVPVDPADVRKAVLEAKLSVDDPKILALRERLFGYWEMNWVGFNTARDFDLTPRARNPLPYLMYPYAEFGATALDGRDPARFNFTLSSVEISGISTPAG